MTQILITKPGTLTAADKKKLRVAGVVTVEAESPQDVRLIGAEGPALDGNDLLFAAMMALNTSSTYSRDARELFAKVVMTLISDARKARKSE